MKREDMEKDLESMGKAPKGIKDIFHQCRGFEKAFTIAVDVRCPPMKPETLNPSSSMTAYHPSAACQRNALSRKQAPQRKPVPLAMWPPACYSPSCRAALSLMQRRSVFLRVRKGS